MPFSASSFRDSSARLLCESPSDVEQPTRPYETMYISLRQPLQLRVQSACTSLPRKISDLKNLLFGAAVTVLCHFGSSYRARECMRMDEMIGSACSSRTETLLYNQEGEHWLLGHVRKAVALTGWTCDFCGMASRGCTGTTHCGKNATHSLDCSYLQPSMRRFRHHQNLNWAHSRAVAAFQCRKGRGKVLHQSRGKILTSATAAGEIRDSYDVVIVGAGALLGHCRHRQTQLIETVAAPLSSPQR